jgi:outer membrane lipoprotein-sorting protein
MAPYGTDDSTTAAKAGTEAEEPRALRRRAARYAVPVAVVGVTAATIGLVPAFAGAGDPDLPEISAQRLLENMAASDTERLSGTLRITTDLGLPDFGGLAESLLGGSLGSVPDGSASADPTERLMRLATGSHLVRVAVDGPDRQRVSLGDGDDEYRFVHDGEDVWGYDAGSKAVYHATVDAHGEGGRGGAEPPVTPGEFAEEALKAADGTTEVEVEGTARVAGRDAYELVLRPKSSGSTVDRVTVAVDAGTWVPLRFTVSSSDGRGPIFDAGFTRVSYERPSASEFTFTPPKGAKVTEADDIEQREEPENSKDAEELRRKAEDLGLGEGLFNLADLGPFGGPEGDGDEGVRFVGEGWSTVAVLGSGADKPSGDRALPEDDEDLPEAFGGFLDSFADEVSGRFGKGTVYGTRLVNALVTEDGVVYVGAVTKDTLVRTANGLK